MPYGDALVWTGEPIIDRARLSGVVRTVPDSTLGGDETSQLVSQAQAGNRHAFDRLHERYAAIVHGMLLAHAPVSEVPDLLQVVFIKAWEKLADLREGAAFGGWLATLARNCATDFHRRRREESSLEQHELPDRRSEVHAEAIRIMELIRTLPEAYRETLALRLVEGRTGPEIAESTGLTHGSVRVNLHRGLQLLRERLGVTL